AVDAAIEERDVEAHLELGTDLGTDVGIAGRRRNDRALTDGPTIRLPDGTPVEGPGLPSRLPERGPEPQGVDRSETPERLLRHHPRRGDLRVVLSVEVGSE